MNMKSLEKKLTESGIPKSYYSLSGGLPNEAQCIEFVNGGWLTYYSERGQKTGLRFFTSESEACHDFYAKLVQGFGLD